MNLKSDEDEPARSILDPKFNPFVVFLFFRGFFASGQDARINVKVFG